MAFKVKTKTGKNFTLLNPAEKSKKYAEELKDNCARTNDMKFKTDDYGVIKQLTKAQRIFRSGYLSHSEDSQDAYKAKNPELYPKDEVRAKKKARRERRRANSQKRRAHGNFMSNHFGGGVRLD